MEIHIGRRELLYTLVSGTVIAWPLAAHAQSKMPTIGALVIGNINPEQFWREFRQGLRDLGYVEGQNIRFEFRSAEGHLERLPELANELVRLKVDIIVTWFTPTAVAAKQATREIPIVMAETGDPIGTGLVASLPRPGGNVTGMASVTAELAGKSVQLIREMLPSARRVTALANASDPFSKPFLEQIRLGGEATGTTINAIGVSSNEEFETAFAGMEQDRPDALIVQPSLPTKRAAELAVKHRVPAVSVPRWFAEEGGLMSYFAAHVLEREDCDGWLVGKPKLGERCWRNVVQANPVHSHVARNILELLLAHVLESKVKPSADLFINFAGNAYPARLCDAPVDPLAINADIVVDDVADVDANAELHAALRLDCGFALCHLGVDGDRAPQQERRFKSQENEHEALK